MILTTLFTADNGEIWSIDVNSAGRIVRLKRFLGITQSKRKETPFETEKDFQKIVGIPLSTISGDFRLGNYVVVAMKSGAYRVFPISDSEKKIFSEYREFFLENKIENYKNTMEFLKL